MKNLKHLSAMAILLASLGAVTACSENNAESVGEKIDQAATDAGNAIEDACEDVKEGVDAKDTDC